jgi:hypothetical protein
MEQIASHPWLVLDDGRSFLTGPTGGVELTSPSERKTPTTPSEKKKRGRPGMALRCVEAQPLYRAPSHLMCIMSGSGQCYPTKALRSWAVD